MKVLILSGGSGTRLFPLSRELYPKQFLKFGDKYSFFQKTFLRNKKLVEDYNDILILTNEKYKFLVRNHLMELIGKERAEDEINILLEPIK
ncbi:MAG: mannose-1-phosphate guanylyltransferase/mannose-6-phosphate isomerase, partial [Persephonella sp.]